MEMSTREFLEWNNRGTDLRLQEVVAKPKDVIECACGNKVGIEPHLYGWGATQVRTESFGVCRDCKILYYRNTYPKA